jgi:hypothetical protein
VDKAGVEYINHPQTVSSMCSSTEAKIVGWLHDVIEDTDVTLDDLKKAGFPDDILEALRCITKETGYQLDDYYFPEGYEIELVEVDNNEQNETGSGAISKDKSHKVYNVVFSKYYGNYGYSIIKVLSFTTKQKSLNYINSVVDAWKIIGHNIDAENDVWKINNSGIKYKIELKESKVY